MRYISFLLGASLLFSLFTTDVVLAQDPAPTPAGTPTANPSVPITIAPELFSRGQTALNNRDIQGARLDFSLFIVLNPTFSEAYFGRAITYVFENNADAALTDLQEAILYGESAGAEFLASVYQLQGDLYRQQGELEQASTAYTEALALADISEVYGGRGLIALEQRNWEGALEDFSDAITHADDPQPSLYLYRAYALVQLDRTDEAVADYADFASGIRQETVNGTPLRNRSAQNVALASGRVIEYVFEATAGDTVTFYVTPAGSNVDPLLILFDPSGEAVAADDDSGGQSSALLRLEIPETGEYTLWLTHSLGGSNGNVSIQFELETGDRSQDAIEPLASDED